MRRNEDFGPVFFLTGEFVKHFLMNRNLFNRVFRSFFFWVIPSDMQDLSSPTRGRTYAPCSGSTQS